MKLVPFLDKDVMKMSNGEIKDATSIIAKNLKEEKGGMFSCRPSSNFRDYWLSCC